MLEPVPVEADLPALVARVHRLARSRPRVLIGITGAPGAGKSTLADRLATALAPSAVVVPLDGFHLGNALLRGTELARRKGAVDTFDLAGYRVLLERLRVADEDVVYAPSYSRDVEEPIAASIAVPRHVAVVVTEGNYLLDDAAEARRARVALDEVWYLDIDDEVRLRRLVDRHVRYGKAPADALAWARGSDEANAVRIRAARPAADIVVRLR